MITITRTEFDKKVDMEFAYLTHINRLPEQKARQQACENVSKEFTTQISKDGCEK